MEGYMDKDFNARPTTISYRHNNPGNLRMWGKYPRKKGYVIFPSHEVGWKALYRQVELNINRELTLREFFGGKPKVYYGYAPSKDHNNPVKYAEFISSYLRRFTPRVMGIDQVLTTLIVEEENNDSIS